MIVRCPRCGQETDYSPENPYRPFCSKRCKESDLYNWLCDEPESADVPPDDLAGEAELILPPASNRKLFH